MTKIIYILSTSLGGAFGWYLGSRVGVLMTSFFTSICGTAFGMYFAQRFNRNYMP